MPRVERDIVVKAPLQMVYNQWTQFEEFPQFMEGVEEVRQLDDSHLLWRADIAGRDTEWEAEIREQVPDQRVAWHSTSGRGTAGLVEFEPQQADETKIHLEMDYELEGVVENIGDALGVIERRVEGDLARFKDFIESRSSETGGWRGEIEGGQARGGDAESRSELSEGARGMRGPAGAPEAEVYGGQPEVESSSRGSAGEESGTREGDPQEERRRAEQRQEAPGPGGAPGGQGRIDPETGELDKRG